MDIRLENVDVDDVLTTKGPQVELTLEDKGQANVAMMLSLDDGTHISYPGTDGKVALKSTTLAPRVYLGALTIIAMQMDTFPKTYRSKVTVNGKILATARGKIPDGAKTDQHTKVFELRVTA